MISVCLSLGTNSSPQLQASQVAYTAVFFVGFTAQCLAVLCDTLQHMRHCQHCQRPVISSDRPNLQLS